MAWSGLVALEDPGLLCGGLGWQADQVHREGPSWSPLTTGASLSHPALGPGDRCHVGGRVRKIEFP